MKSSTQCRLVCLLRNEWRALESLTFVIVAIGDRIYAYKYLSIKAAHYHEYFGSAHTKYTHETQRLASVKCNLHSAKPMTHRHSMACNRYGVVAAVIIGGDIT